MRAICPKLKLEFKFFWALSTVIESVFCHLQYLVCNFQLQPINICFEILFFIRRNRTSWWHQNIEQEIFPLFLHIFAFIHRSLLIKNYNSVLILALAVAYKTCACHFIYSAIRWLCVFFICLFLGWRLYLISWCNWKRIRSKIILMRMIQNIIFIWSLHRVVFVNVCFWLHISWVVLKTYGKLRCDKFINTV